MRLNKFSVYLLALFLVVASVVLLSEQKVMAMTGTGSEADPYIIMNADDLSSIRDNPAAHYQLGNDIQMSGNWEPIASFNGTLDGNGYVISGLKVHQPDIGFTGLIAQSNGAVIKNIGLVNVDLTGGGLYMGALVAYFQDSTIQNSYATGNANGDSVVGGLVGRNVRGSIENSYALVNVTGINQLGGISGSLQGGTLINCYAAGSVTKLEGTSTLIGGINGHVQSTAGGTVTNSYWDGETTGQPTSVGGGELKTTSQMMQQSTYESLGGEAWDFANVWQIQEGVSYPTLRVFGEQSQLPSFDRFDVGISYQIGSTADGSLVEGKLLKAVAEMFSKQDVSQDVLLIVTLYDQGGAMVNLDYASVRVGAGETELPSAGFKLPANIAGHTVKIFVWGGSAIGLTDMMPLSQVTTIGN